MTQEEAERNGPPPAAVRGCVGPHGEESYNDIMDGGRRHRHLSHEGDVLQVARCGAARDGLGQALSRGAVRSWLAWGWALVRLGRPVFLGGGCLLYALGAAVAAAHGHPSDPLLYLLGQAAVSTFQLMTHYANDYFDYEADRANTTPTRWSGGSRVLVRGELPREVALGVALLLAAVGLDVILALAGMEGVGSLAPPALVVAVVLSWEYSAPPLRLHSSGLGELAVALVVTALVPFIGFSLQAPDLVGCACCCWRWRRFAAYSSRCCWPSRSRMRSVTERWASAPWWCVSAPSARRDSMG